MKKQVKYKNRDDSLSKKGRLWLLGGGALAGFVNGLLGSGGGMLALPALRKSGLDTRRSHAGALAVMFPLSLFSATMYLLGGRVEFKQALPYIPGGIIGAVLGAVFLRKIPTPLLRRVFGFFALWAGVKLILR